MPTNRFLGNAPPVAHVVGWTFGGTWETSDVVNVTINGKTVSKENFSSTTISTIVDECVTALNASTIPEFAEITWSRSSNDLRATADTLGRPHGTISVTTTETGGGAADAQTIGSATTVTANSGPNAYDAAANWSLAAVPVNSDDVLFSGHGVDCLYGLDQNAVTPASIVVDPSYRGRIGLPQANAGGYAEYRPTYLRTAAPIVTWAGSGQRGRIDVVGAAAVITVNNTGTSDETGLETLLLKGSAMTSITVNKGSVGVAVLGGETSAVTTVNTNYVSTLTSDAKLRLGSGVTAPTTINCNGGTLETNSGTTTTVNNRGCVHTHRSGATTTYNNKRGTRIDRSSSTTTTYASDTGTLDLSTLASAPTYTNCTINKGSTVKNPLRTSTWTNGIILNNCRAEDVTLDLGNNVKLTITNL